MKCKQILGLLLACALFVACRTAPAPGTTVTKVTNNAKTPDVVAVINGRDITVEELDERAANQLSKAQAQIYEIRRRTLDGIIGEILVDAAAAKTGQTADDYLDTEIYNKIIEPTDASVKLFYEQRKSQLGGRSFKQVKPQIAQYLKSAQQQQLQNELGKKLKDAADIKVYLEPPRAKVSLEGGASKGKAGAPITLVEFTDYDCPFCNKTRPAINKVLEKYGDKVHYVLRDFPLSFHKDAPKAHAAAHCAGDQGKYWEYSDVLFTKQRKLQADKLKTYAEELALDMEAFNTCLDADKYAERVQQGLSDGMAVGVSGTPAFFINGIPLSGAKPYEEFERLIEDELNRK